MLIVFITFFKNNFPKNWVRFGELLKDFLNFDVLHLNYQKHLATPLFHEIKPDGVYGNGEKLAVKTIEFGHYRAYPFELPSPRLIINFENKSIEGYIQKDLSESDENIILNL